MALAEGIPVYQPARLRNNMEAVERIRSWSPDVAIVAAFLWERPNSRFLRWKNSSSATP